MDIDSSGRIPIIPPDQTLISDHVRDKGGQGARPQYYAQRRTPPEEPPAEEVVEETPAAEEEPGKPKHLIDIKV